jgi:23S rRNA pseudouridine1911/1915/1917 synthase
MQFVVSSAEAGQRLDQFLAGRLPALSRSQLQRLIRGEHVRVGRARAKPALIVDAGLVVDVELPAPARAEPEPEDLALSVIYEDADIVVVDKAAGMVVHPSAGHGGGTLVNALLHHVKGLSGIGGVLRPGIVHRLDRGTSGIMVVAKHDAAHRELARQFHDREVVKEYLALVWGAPREGQRLEQPIGRDRRNRQKMSSRSAHAREALTTVVDVERFRGVSLIRVRIGTGRTHQIRVHLSEAGHAVVGDATYGGTRAKAPAHLGVTSKLRRPFLHSARLGFAHPRTGAPLTFDAPLPADLAATVDALRRVPNPESRK